MTKIPVKLGILSEDNNTNDFLFITSEIGERPSRTSIIGEFYPEGFVPVLEKYNPSVINTVTEIVVNDDEITNVRYLTKLDNDIYVSYLVLHSGSEEDEIITNVSFLFGQTKIADVDAIIEELEVTIDEVNVESEEHVESLPVYSMTVDEGNIRLEPFHDKPTDFSDIKLYYNDTVLKSVEESLTTLLNEPKGILFITGEKGVGKTNLIKYMVTRMDFTLRIIYVPVQLFEVFNANDINRFVSNNPNSIFILDDFDGEDYNYEKTIASIIHMVDGYKSDIYNCSFIISTNKDFIEDMFESNNLHETIEVDALTLVKAKALCKKLKLKTVNPESNDLRLVSVLKQKNCGPVVKTGY